MYRLPNLREYLVLKYSADTEQKLETAEEIFGGNADLREIDRYIAEIDEIMSICKLRITLKNKLKLITNATALT